MDYIDISEFKILSQTGSILQLRRTSTIQTLSAIAFDRTNWTDEQNHAFFNNLEKFSKLNLPFLVKYYGYSLKSDGNNSELYVIVESFDEYLDQHLSGSNLTSEQVKTYLMSISSTIATIDDLCHKKISYLTPENILIQKNFGETVLFKLFPPLISEKYLESSSNIAKWMSPELYEKVFFAFEDVRESQIHKNSIVYSLGLLSVLMVSSDITLIKTRNIVFDGRHKENMKKFEDSTVRNYIIYLARLLKRSNFVESIRKMLEFNPDQRPDISRVLEISMNPDTSITFAENRDQLRVNIPVPLPTSASNDYVVLQNENPNFDSYNIEEPPRREIRRPPANNNARSNVSSSNNVAFRLLTPPDFNKKTFTFVVTMFQISVFLITCIYDNYNSDQCSLYYFGANYTPSIVVYHQYFRLITPIFLHADLLHLIMNMAFQYKLGFTMERFVGTSKFIIIYMTAGVTGNILSAAFSPESLGVGASGALFGIIHMKFLYDLQYIELRRAEKNYFTMLIIYFLFSLLPGISFYGHLGGYLGGFLVSTWLVRSQKWYRVPEWCYKYCWAILMAVWVVLIVYIRNLHVSRDYARYYNKECGSFFW